MDPREFRNAMGRFVTGVTIITAEDDAGTHGMTANAFMSVSLDPKLITVSIDNKANMLGRVRNAGKFAVNILCNHQQDVSMHFAKQLLKEEPIEFGELSGVPIINNALTNVVCDVEREIELGDHTLFVGAVKDIVMNEGRPLTFYSGQYGQYEVPND
ncbi:flavin reductase family protein [Aliicoccus persicus]|uniref:NADH-FMN oxidoreductase RutF, flavin reductase (DIM6/NTAB) family n=1 Tax=Aliicoccus persicus TaxID=930138 RepID=A0A662Z4C2_9STAP|nr:flavin reductase family protein [Aliicoccus persicus]SEV91823.1 NADH-FMN oxidoreductase RutF, flavin reductase (DIM6/NTAB) family [Aliicoccus persicus]